MLRSFRKRSHTRHLLWYSFTQDNPYWVFEARISCGQLYPYVRDELGELFPFAGSCPLPFWEGLSTKEKELVALKYIRKAADVKKGKAIDFGKKDPEFAKSYPALTEYLTANEHDDGKARQTATLFIFVEAGDWKVCLTDRELGETCWVTASSLKTLLESLEERVQQGEGVWSKKKTQKRS